MARKKAFPLRMDPDLYEELRRWAEAELRSVNGQIEYLLRDAVDRRLGRSGRRAGSTNERSRGGAEKRHGDSPSPPAGAARPDGEPGEEKE